MSPMRQKRNHLITPAGMRIVDELVGRHPQTVAELLERLEVTRTAITEQLDELVAGGWVLRERDHEGGRGRPKFRYSLTKDARTVLFPAGTGLLLVPSVWRVVKQIGGEPLLDQVVEGVCQEIAEKVGDMIIGPSPMDCFLQTMQAVAPQGERLKITKSPEGHAEICRRACGVAAMNDKHGTLCRMHVRILQLAVKGGEVQRIQHRMDGHPCCIFRLVEMETEE